MKAQMKEYPFLTNSLFLNRKIHLVYENSLHRNWVPGGEYAGLPHWWIMSGGEKCRHSWLADTCLATLANAPFRPEQSMEAYRNFWHWMDNNPHSPRGTPRYGMIPAGVLTDHGSYYSTYYYSQTPIIAWTLMGIYGQTGDKSFLRESLPRLVAFHDWYERERDIDEDRLIEIGSYGQEERQPRMETIDLKQELDELAIRNEAGGYWAHWGRGKPGVHMSVDRLLVTNRQKEPTGDRFYANVELVESTAGMILMEKSIADAARELGESTLETRFRAFASAREAAMNEMMWNPDDGFYCDLNRDTHEKLRTKGWGQFLPLLSGSASKEQAAQMVKRLSDPRQFWTSFPVSLHAQRDLSDSSADVRDTSVAVNCLISVGLHAYGYHDLALELTKQTIEMLDENRCEQRYSSATGKALGGCYESIAAMVLPMICQSYYGVAPDCTGFEVTDRMLGGWIRYGTLCADYSQPGEIQIRSELDRRIRLSLPPSWSGPSAAGKLSVHQEETEGGRRKTIAFSAGESPGEIGVTMVPGKTVVVCRQEHGA